MLAQLFLIQLSCTNVEAGRKSTARLWSIFQMSAFFGALPFTRTKKCNQKKCPADCVMSERSGFSKFTATAREEFALKLILLSSQYMGCFVNDGARDLDYGPTASAVTWYTFATCQTACGIQLHVFAVWG